MFYKDSLNGTNAFEVNKANQIIRYTVQNKNSELLRVIAPMVNNSIMASPNALAVFDIVVQDIWYTVHAKRYQKHGLDWTFAQAIPRATLNKELDDGQFLYGISYLLVAITAIAFAFACVFIVALIQNRCYAKKMAQYEAIQSEMSRRDSVTSDDRRNSLTDTSTFRDSAQYPPVVSAPDNSKPYQQQVQEFTNMQ